MFHLKHESETTLNMLVSFLNKNKKIKIEIQGHTDNFGDKTNNQELSKNRAKSVMIYLIGKGISAKRLIYKGFGSSLPIDSNKTEKGRKNNRRVEIKIIE